MLIYSEKWQKELNSSDEDSTLHALIKMEYSREEAFIAIERCGNHISHHTLKISLFYILTCVCVYLNISNFLGETASVADVIDFISAARLAREYDDFFEEVI